MNNYSLILKERIEEYGIKGLSTSEILALILNVDVEQVLECFDSTGTNVQTLQEHIVELKISKEKKQQLIAVYEFSKRVNGFIEKKTVINSPQLVASMVMEELRQQKQEHFVIIMLDTKMRFMKKHTVSIGTLQASVVHPREVFSEAIKDRASSIVLIHNHPSGDPSPSVEDIETTKRLNEAGKILGINIADHIIIGDGSYYSHKEAGIL